MRTSSIIRLCTAFLLLGGVWVAYTQMGSQPAKLDTIKVKDDLFVIHNNIVPGNSTALVTNEGVILVDDKFEVDHDGIMAELKKITDKPLKYVINTHHHADHSGGNAKMYDSGAQIISTANARKNILEKRQPNAPPNVLPARIVFTDETSVFLGGKEVRAHHYGRGHTNGDAVIYFPLLKVVHTGDLMSGATPLIDYNGGGSVVEWPKTLDAVMQGNLLLFSKLFEVFNGEFHRIFD